MENKKVELISEKERKALKELLTFLFKLSEKHELTITQTVGILELAIFNILYATFRTAEKFESEKDIKFEIGG